MDLSKKVRVGLSAKAGRGGKVSSGQGQVSQKRYADVLACRVWAEN